MNQRQRTAKALSVALEALRRIRDWTGDEDADDPGDYASRKLAEIRKIMEGK